MIYETKRLFLRHFENIDADKCMESWGQDNNLGKYIVGYPFTELEQMENFVSQMSKQMNAWLITEKASEEVVGYITVDIPYEALKIGEVGYVIGEKYQGNNYSSEVLKFILV